MNNIKPLFNSRSYWSITAILFTGTVSGCEYCIPLLAATLITGALTKLLHRIDPVDSPETVY